MRCPILAGVVVAELGSRIGAGVCGSLLAELGATVVVPERPRANAHKLRYRDLMLAGKQSLVPGEAGDAPLLERLVQRSDILLLSSDLDPGERPGAWVSSDSRIECDITAFGDSGPRSGEALSDLQIQALSGIADTTGLADGPPTPIRLPIVEYMTGAYAAAACLAAWRVRQQGGGGQAIDMALYDCAFASMATFLPRLLDGSGSTVGRVGNRHAMASPWNVFRALDGWVLVCASSDAHWRSLCAVLERPELAQDPRYLRIADRVARHQEVDGLLRAWVERGTVERCATLIGAAGVPCGLVAKVEGCAREANLQHRGAIRRLPGGDRFMPASSLRLSRTPGQSLDRIPAPHEDRAAILGLLEEGSRASNLASSRRAMPLAGLRVLELGHYTTAPLAARHLANLGAEVIKIEPLEGEAVRPWSSAKKGTGYFFTYTNADKLSVVLDLKAARDVQSLQVLIRTSDVLIENLKPGTLAKIGLSATEMAELNPRLVYCAVSGFGLDSIYPGRPAVDTVIQAMSGLMDLTRAGDVPVKAGISLSDLMGAELALVAVLAALEERERSGLGQFIDLSMQDVSAWLTAPLWRNAEASPRPVVLRAQDGFVLAEVEEGAALPEHRPDLMRAALTAALTAAGHRAAPILSAAEALQDEQTRARDLVFTAKDAEGEPWPLLASPLRLLGTPPIVARPMGPLGSDGPAILAPGHHI